MATCPSCHRSIAEGITCSCQRRLVRAPGNFRALVDQWRPVRPAPDSTEPPAPGALGVEGPDS